MHRSATRRCARRIVLASALAATLLGGCSAVGGPLALLRGPAEERIVQNETIVLAEAAVLGSPSDPMLRARLGSAYLSAGRFGSAATSLADAMALGDTVPATTLRLALALTGSGRADEAAELLFDRAEELPPADLGLALAMAGEADAAIRFMDRAIRDGGNTVALRQNLALAYALAGRWREARLMAALDVPAHELGARMERWAALAMMGGTPQRLAMVMRVPVGVPDPGMPVALTLAPVEPKAARRVARSQGPVLAEPARVAEAGPAVMLAASGEPVVVEPIRIALPVRAAEPVVAAGPLTTHPASAPAEAVAPVPARAEAATPPARRVRTLARRHLRSPGARW